LVVGYRLATKVKELQSRLSVAARHIAEAQAIIARQQERVTEALLEGSLSPDAQNTLNRFVETLNVLRDEALRLQHELAELK